MFAWLCSRPSEHLGLLGNNQLPVVGSVRGPPGPCKHISPPSLSSLQVLKRCCVTCLTLPTLSPSFRWLQGSPSSLCPALDVSAVLAYLEAHPALLCQVHSAILGLDIYFLGFRSETGALCSSKWILESQFPPFTGEQIEFVLMASRLLICLNQLNDQSGIVYSAC